MTTEAKKVTIDDVEYDLATFTEEQRAYLAHIQDIDAKMAQTRFQMDQLNVGRGAFFTMLKNSLPKA